MENESLKIKNYLEQCVKERIFPGASWIVGSTDKVFEKDSIGVLGEGLDPVNLDSIYDIASLTKVFVSLALIKQLEDGLIRLEDEVSYFLPAFINNPLGEVTVLALMTHANPFPGGTRLYKKAHTRDELLKALASCELRSDSNSRVVYTCEAYILLGEIIKAAEVKKTNRITGLDEIIKHRVIEPLRLKETCFLPSKELLPRIAPTEYCSIRGKMIRAEVHDENAMVMGGVSGNAGIFSKVTDMSFIGKAMLDSLDGKDNAFLCKASAQMMIKNHTSGMGQNRGLGWVLSGPNSSAGDLMSRSSFGHSGFTGTSIWIDPERKLYAVLFSNRIHPKRDNFDDYNPQGIFRVRHIFHNLVIREYCHA